MMFPFANMNVMNNPNFINMNMNMFQEMGNDITEQEIQKHKKTLNKLIMKLNNTHNIDEEISINNEIRKETEFLSSLFNIKKDELNLQNLNDNNNINQFMMMNNDLMANMIKNMNDDKYEANKEWMKGFRMVLMKLIILNQKLILFLSKFVEIELTLQQILIRQ